MLRLMSVKAVHTLRERPFWAAAPPADMASSSCAAATRCCWRSSSAYATCQCKHMHLHRPQPPQALHTSLCPVGEKSCAITPVAPLKLQYSTEKQLQMAAIKSKVNMRIA